MFKAKEYKIESSDENQVLTLLNKRTINENDFMVLLSEEAGKYLEEMAQRVYREHLNHFGKAVTLYTPLYLANYCVNQCVYCSYNIKNNIVRHKLNNDEIHEEAKRIAETGLRHILLLTGESEKDTPFEYIKNAVSIVRKYFDSVTIEVYPLTEVQYRELNELGVEGLTIYQETYDQELYKKVHPYGPKKDYNYRLDAPKRGADAGLYTINIGALLGLGSWQYDAYNLGRHLKYLEKINPNAGYHISVPRIRPFKGQTFHSEPIEDKTLVQMILAIKLYCPHIGINLSTRESAEFREHLLPLGIAKMSAGVQTSVGGHSKKKGDAQFEIADDRSVHEVKKMLHDKGYQAVLKDWVGLYENS
jgi:2-iminoacetate synthase